MSAPEFVPTKAAQRVRTYSSPPQRFGGWQPDRPGDLGGRQPQGERLGSQGPDQGYALTIGEHLRDQLRLEPGEHAGDALAGAAAIATKRASMFGRAPVVHDMVVALTIWGFLEDKPSKSLRHLRHQLFEECRVPHHYGKLRAIAAAVPASVLAQPHQAIIDQYQDGWNQVIQVAD